MDINWTSLLTGIAGGIIPAAVAYYMGKRNLEASLRINEQKLIADRENLSLQLEAQEQARRVQYAIELEKINYEEKKKAILEFFEVMDPERLLQQPFSFADSARSEALISLLCPQEYFSYIQRIHKFMILNPQMAQIHLIWKESKGEWAWLNDIFYAYHDVYSNAWEATKNLFQGIPVKPAPPLIDLS